MLSLSLQTFGGSGYISDYPIEQYLRDQKIDSLYEGTTHIQALDLIFRKVMRDSGQTLQWLFGQIQNTAQQAKEAQLHNCYSLLLNACKEAQLIMMTMMQKMQESIYHAGLQGNRIIQCIAEIVIAWLLVRQAEIAYSKKANANLEDKNFYTSKIATAQFYCEDILPFISCHRQQIEQSKLDIMELSEESW